MQIDSADNVACGAALLYSLTLTLLNFTPAFSSSENILAFGIFAGCVLKSQSKKLVVAPITVKQSCYHGNHE